MAVLGACGCTTYVQPATCTQGASGCGGLDDARFCQDMALAVEGSDCAVLGIAASRPFCVVTTKACIDTEYAIKGRDCRVLRYQGIRDSASEECSPDVPMFVAR